VFYFTLKVKNVVLKIPILKIPNNKKKKNLPLYYFFIGIWDFSIGFLRKFIF
jgi:hypothetical protein